MHLPPLDYHCLVIGDVMVDRYLNGSVERISPEAPVPVVLYTGSRSVAGGAGNVANNIVSLGGAATIVSVAGLDQDGRELEDLLAAAGVRGLLVKDPERPTITKTRLMSGFHQMMRLDQESTAAILAQTEQGLCDQFDSALPSADFVLISDYAKGALTDRVLRHVIDTARRAGKPTLVDPKRSDFAIYSGASLIKPNLKELRAATGIACRTEEEIAAAALKIIQITGADLLVTRSELGMMLFSGDAPPVQVATEAQEVFDVSGAGDTAIAAFALCCAAKMTPPQALRVANAAAGLAVAKAGTASVSAEELERFLDHADLEANFTKGANVGLGQALELVRLWRRQGLVIGFTNGCFDLLHPGHVKVLQRARAECDRLIVALNSDASVSRLKGPSRPVQSEESRAAVIGAMAAVDLVLIFDEETPLRLIEAIRPDVLVKGSDYSEAQVVGGEVVKAAGGKILLVDLVDGQSTTNLLRKGAASEVPGAKTAARRNL